MKVIVSAVSFSKNKQLIEKLLTLFPDAILNNQGIRYYDQDLVLYYKDADAILVGVEKIDEKLLSQLPNLKFIAKYGVGLNNIDFDACRKYGVKVGWKAGVNRYSVAEMTVGLILMLSRNLYVTSNQLKDNYWNKNGGWSISGKTLGIIGLGNIGKELVRLLTPFNINFLANDIKDISSFANENKIEITTKEEIFCRSDIISVHTPLDKKTTNLINKSVFKKMKEDAILINTARGGIVNEDDLIDALRKKTIAGAATDVYTIEPPKNMDLLSIPNLITTPHIAGNSKEAVISMGMAAIESLNKFKMEL